MKLFDVNWMQVLHDLARWDALDRPARQVLLHAIKPSGSVPVQELGAQRDVLIDAGFARLDAAQRRATLPDERRPLVRVLRAMHRHPVFDAPSPAALAGYLAEHFTSEAMERAGRGMRGHGPYFGRAAIAALVGYEGWTGDLLAAATNAQLGHWATHRGVVLTTPPAASLGVLHDLQQLARTLLAHPDGMPLRELAAEVEEAGRSTIADALYAGLELMVVFGGLRDADLEPMVGLWPPVAHALRRPASRPPAAVTPEERFALAVRVEDMITVLVAATAEPIRLRANDHAVFARARKAIDARLVSLPAWVATMLELDADVRVDGAVDELRWRDLARVHDSRDAPHLGPTAAGARWLAASPHDRLAALLDPMRKSKEQNPRGAYDMEQRGMFFPYTLPYYRPPTHLRLRDALTTVFLATGDAFVSVEDFLDHAASAKNPLNDQALSAGPAGSLDLMYLGPGDPREHARALWRDMLQRFLVHRLAAFGGVAIGRLADGRFCFALSEVGRYLLGATDGFEYGAPEVAEVIVQPNFEIVFLSVAPAAEAAIARFAERAGPAPGIAFRITRASVLAAAEGGATTDDLLGTLGAISVRAIPSNVEREIRGWMSQVRRATMRTALLIECADVETAERAAALLGGKSRRLAPTIFELPAATASVRTAMVRRLRAGGVFLGGPTEKPDRGSP